jgi:outer membrane receptor protein involved in Fe transport
MNPKTSKLATLLGSASMMTIASATAQAQQVAQAQMAQAGAQEVPEQVLITGSLIRGTAAVGVPVTNLSPQDFAQTGALTTADLFRTVPSANVSPGPVATQSGANIERATRVNIRGLDTGDFTRSLMMVDGVRTPPQGNGVCELDPSIIPALSLDRIDILVDGASATYGSDAVAGVINIILKRGFDGAITQLRYTTAQGGKQRYQASQLWGRTWDGGDITLGYEWYDDSAIQNSAKSKMSVNYTPWGLDDRTPLGQSIPGTLSTGAPTQSATWGVGTSATLGTNCSNCWAIPQGTGRNFNSALNGGLGPTAPFTGSTLNWATFNVAGNTGTNGTRNEFNPYSIAWFDAAQQRNAATMTIDQRLTRNIQFTGEAYYSNRRASYLNPANLSPSSFNELTTAVPTWNPYYPTGGAPQNLRVSYVTAVENPSYTQAYELASRYMIGFNIDLPGGWVVNPYYAETYDSSFNHVTGSVNRNAVSAALGWTIAPSIATGTGPGIASWTKPSSVPYLNLFCDPTQFQCNADTTLNYVTGLRSFNEKFWINEKGVKADGPLFSLPAGDVKAAIGANYTTYTFGFVTFDNTGAPSLVLPYLTDAIHRSVWAVFTQVNVPVIGDANALPLIRKFEIEGSWRHDQYSDVGGTSNPKVAFNWTVDEDWGITVRGSWGTSFNAPGFGVLSPLANNNVQAWNTPLFPTTVSQTINISNPDVGSAGDKLLHPVVGPAFAANAAPAGVSLLGSATTARTAHFRDFVNTEGFTLHPETSTNWSVGGEFAPTTFLKGLDIQATWYQIKINGTLGSFGNPTSNSFNQGGRGFSYIVPTDLRGIDPACNNNLLPSTCPEFQLMVNSIIADPRSSVQPSINGGINGGNQVYWINDGGTFNKGWRKMSGIDFSASYDYDAGDLGAWNAGIVGTYYIKDEAFTVPGTGVIDTFHATIAAVGGISQVGVESLPRFRYRTRLGWSNGPWSVTGFMDYQSHFFHTQGAPPNVNFQCTATGGTIPGGSLPCLINNYTNIEPSQYTFDLSLGYDTGDDPANDYLKHIGLQLVVQNVMDRAPAFEYRTSTGGGNPAPYDILKSYQGRTISVILTKTW